MVTMVNFMCILLHQKIIKLLSKQKQSVLNINNVVLHPFFFRFYIRAFSFLPTTCLSEMHVSEYLIQSFIHKYLSNILPFKTYDLLGISHMLDNLQVLHKMTKTLYTIVKLKVLGDNVPDEGLTSISSTLSSLFHSTCVCS